MAGISWGVAQRIPLAQRRQAVLNVDVDEVVGLEVQFIGNGRDSPGLVPWATAHVVGVSSFSVQ